MAPIEWYIPPSEIRTTFSYKDCNTFVYDNGYCYLGKTTLSNGTISHNGLSSTIATFYTKDSGLTDYLVPNLTTTYCCVVHIQENLGRTQLNVNSGRFPQYDEHCFNNYFLRLVSYILWKKEHSFSIIKDFPFLWKAFKNLIFMQIDYCTEV